MSEDSPSGIWGHTKALASTWASTKRQQLQNRGTPSTKVDSGGTRDNYSFQGQEIDRSELRDIKKIRESGGVIAQLVHGKALMQFGMGASFECENDEAAEWLHDQFNDLDNLLIDIGEDATWFPFSLGEIVETQAGDFSHVELIEPWTMVPITNDVGEIVAWEQEIRGNGTKQVQTFDPDEIASFVLNKAYGRDKTGLSEVKRAEEEIENYKGNQRTINDALEYLIPHHHWKVGQEGGMVIDDNELRRFRNKIDNLQGDTQIVSGQDVSHEAIDLPEFDVQTITDNDMRQLCVALGVPIELASVIAEGLGSGEQSNAREQFFQLERRAKQRSLGGQFIEEIARQILEDYSPYDPEQELDLVFDETQELEERKKKVDAIGDDMTVNERRSMFDLAELDDPEKGESFDSPGEESSNDDPFGGMLNAALEDRDMSQIRALEDGFDATLFELVATEEQEDFETGARLGIGVEFPNSGVYVDWNIDAWPEEERLDGPHVSDYATIDDAQKVAQGEVRELSASELAGDSGNLNERHECSHNLSKPDNLPEWEDSFLTLQSELWEAEPETKLLEYSGSATPEFVKQRIRDTILSEGLFSDIESIPSGERMQLQEYFLETLDSDGWTIDGLADQIEQLGVDSDMAETVARTETHSILADARERGYEERGELDDEFYWSGSLGDRTTDTCKYLIAGTNADLENSGAFGNLPRSDGTNPYEGGEPMGLEEFKEHLKRVAEADPAFSTNPREWTPHINCRKTYIRHVE